MRRRLREWLEGRGSGRTITRPDCGPYLRRTYLLRVPQLPEVVFAHTFLRSDLDPVHDHPWDWGRLIIAGRYREHYRDGGSREYGPGSFAWRRPAELYHRIELLTPTVSTIFWHWGRRQDWGFLRPDGTKDVVGRADREERWRGRVLPRKV